MRTIVTLAVGLVLFIAAPAHAAFHLWDFSEVYSNADGSVQFIELFVASNGEQFTRNQRITSLSQQYVYVSWRDPRSHGKPPLIACHAGVCRS